MWIERVAADLGNHFRIFWDRAVSNDNNATPLYDHSMSASHWSDVENDAIVADYFQMLGQESAGQVLNKRGRNRQLQQIIGRSHASIEQKHRNISAILLALGEDWIEGYKPASHFQASLIDAVLRWLRANAEWFERPPRHSSLTSHIVTEKAELWIGPPPTRQNAPPPIDLPQTLALSRHLNVAERDALNRTLGRAGEERALAHERATLLHAGRHDLAERVRWVSDEEGDGAGFDIASFEPDGRTRLIEVKTTNGWDRTPFHISRNELAVADARRDEWCLLRLWNFSRAPKAFELRPPLEAYIELTPTSFQADLI